MRLRLHDALVTPSYYARHEISVSLTDHPIIQEQQIEIVRTHAELEVRNTADLVTCRFMGEVVYRTVCDRCLAPMETSFSFDYIKDVQRTAQSEEFDGIVLDANESFDVEEEIITSMVLAFPAKHLCREDCKGLCPVCGCDLNERQCGCDTKQWDPRLEALRNLKF